MITLSLMIRQWQIQTVCRTRVQIREQAPIRAREKGRGQARRRTREETCLRQEIQEIMIPSSQRAVSHQTRHRRIKAEWVNL